MTSASGPAKAEKKKKDKKNPKEKKEKEAGKAEVTLAAASSGVDTVVKAAALARSRSRVRAASVGTRRGGSSKKKRLPASISSISRSSSMSKSASERRARGRRKHRSSPPRRGMEQRATGATPMMPVAAAVGNPFGYYPAAPLGTYGMPTFGPYGAVAAPGAMPTVQPVVGSAWTAAAADTATASAMAAKQAELARVMKHSQQLMAELKATKEQHTRCLEIMRQIAEDLEVDFVPDQLREEVAKILKQLQECKAMSSKAHGAKADLDHVLRMAEGSLAGVYFRDLLAELGVLEYVKKDDLFKWAPGARERAQKEDEEE